MEILRYESPVLFGQISVHDPAVPDFPLWTDAQVGQGFAWREGHASFMVPDRDGECEITLLLVEDAVPSASDPSRTIVVPLVVGDRVCVATIGEEQEVEVAPGPYRVEFRLMNIAPDRRRIEIVMSPGEAEFAVLASDEEMRIPATFAIGAEAA